MQLPKGLFLIITFLIWYPLLEKKGRYVWSVDPSKSTGLNPLFKYSSVKCDSGVYKSKINNTVKWSDYQCRFNKTCFEKYVREKWYENF